MIAKELRDFREGMDGDVCRVLNAPYEIPRHRRGQARSSYHDVNMLGLSRKKHRGLTGGVAASNDNDVLSTAHLRFNRRGTIINANPFVALQIGQGQLPVPGSTCNDH